MEKLSEQLCDHIWGIGVGKGGEFSHPATRCTKCDELLQYQLKKGFKMPSEKIPMPEQYTNQPTEALKEEAYVNEKLHRIEIIAKENLLITTDVHRRLVQKLSDLFGPDPSNLADALPADPGGWADRTLRSLQDTTELLTDIHSMLDNL